MRDQHVLTNMPSSDMTVSWLESFYETDKDQQLNLSEKGIGHVLMY